MFKGEIIAIVEPSISREELGLYMAGISSQAGVSA